MGTAMIQVQFSNNRGKQGPDILRVYTKEDLEKLKVMRWQNLLGLIWQ